MSGVEAVAHATYRDEARPKGRIDIDTGSGDIELKESSGSLNCDTGSGDS